MQYNSFSFLILFPLVFAVYYLIGKQYRYVFLCAVSVISYIAISPKYFLLFIVTTVTVYASALIIGNADDSIRNAKAKHCFAGCIIINLSILILCKYSGFLTNNINRVLGKLHSDISFSLPFTILVPLGISFYTLQMLGYLIDVYRGKVSAEKNFVKFLLFASFFPTITSGPIERSDNLLRQIQQGVEFDYDKVRVGYLTILWGYYEKFILADMIRPLVNEFFANYDQFGALSLILATVLYSIELYADFSGYSHIAIGVSQMLGFDICENFRQPYFATSIKDFWRRWHISLSTWLRDYLYIPLGGSRCSRAKLYRNLFITFLISGIWHGVGWCFIFWGILHGIYQIIGNITLKYRVKLRRVLRLNDKCFSYRLFQTLITFLLVSFGWFFFRAESLHSAYSMLTWCLNNYNNYNIFDAEAVKNIFIIMLPLIAVDIVKERGVIPQYHVIRQNYLFRWSIYIGGAIIILVIFLRSFGVPSSSFIYAQF